MSMIPLTHVCRYWRDSIISTPENWTLIRNRWLKLAKLSLERAKAAPLAIHLHVQLDRKFVDLLRSHVESIESLSYRGYSVLGGLIKALPNFPKSTPKLRSLALEERSRPDLRLLNPFEFSTDTMLRELPLSHVPLLPSLLSLRSLTKFFLFDTHFDLHVDTLLNFLEENRSLESASLMATFTKPSLTHSRRRTPVGNRLQHLLLSGHSAVDLRPLISGIALRKGATLALDLSGAEALARIFSGVPTTHLSNLSSPTSMEYRQSPRKIRLIGADGSFSCYDRGSTKTSFEEFPHLPLASVRELRLQCCGSRILTEFRLSFSPSLEVLAIHGGSSISFLSPEPSTSTPSPSLRTLAFMDCVITKDFMATLTQIALHRKNSTSKSLHRVVIVGSKWQFPPRASVQRLREYVPIVEVLMGREFPKDLS
ncbi:hypothetical protein BJ322DRAFT_1065842 [Thelephora terrestris]|uniref:F-box domain-containing protein n=1 Tax=Thelephora terrestris TaxID=56493 RepID=A0A9P6HDX5_9AGAM|nr:hypothetical protein BJ322DRAFT_1065842 [Thelephora terrestris]